MVHLSSAETFGLAVLQGLAYKIPVIVNDLASFREWLSDEEVLFINKDLGGSALKAISSFLKNRDEFNKRCKKGYSLAMKYSLSNMINRIKKSVNIVK
jgi:glycosyltransferase involved in cell wall biosynthesis